MEIVVTWVLHVADRKSVNARLASAAPKVDPEHRSPSNNCAINTYATYHSKESNEKVAVYGLAVQYRVV